MTPFPAFLDTTETLDALIAGFENGSWPGSSWTHAAHLALAACYILDGEDALDRLRRGIPRYNESQGGKNTPDSGYHETLTCFWYEIIRAFMASLPAGLNRLDAAKRVVAEFGDRRDLFRDYYDFDVVKSREARARWIPPAAGIPDRYPPPRPPEKSTAQA